MKKLSVLSLKNAYVLFLGDEEVMSFVQRVVGYSVTGLGDEQCIFILNGDGANGKSTLLNVLNQLLGDYARTAPTQTLMANTRQGVGMISSILW